MAVLIILAWQCFKGFLYKKTSSSSASSSTVGFSDSNPIAFGSGGSQFRVSEMVTDADLKFLIENLDEKIGQNKKWDNVIEKGNDLLYYSAKCCKPKNAGVAFVCEMIIYIVKHSFIAKFNDIQPFAYFEFLEGPMQAEWDWRLERWKCGTRT